VIPRRSPQRARLVAQLLAGPRLASPAAVVERLLAVQAQDARGFRLAIRSRTDGLTVDDVDRALDDGSLVVTWLNRGTLHLVPARDYWWLHALTAPRQRAASRRRLAHEGVTEAAARRGVAVVAESVARDGPLTRLQLRARLDDAGVRTAGQALVHVLFAASIERLVVRGPVVGAEQAFMAPEQWLGPAPAPLDPDTALAMLAHRYLAGHAPAAPSDLAAWAGISLGEARRAFGVLDDASAAAAAPSPVSRTARAVPRLLGPFDPLLHGWQSRTPVVGAHGSVVTSNGVFRPIALVDGRAVATWGLAAGSLTIRPLEPIPAAAHRALERDAADVLRFLRHADQPVTWAVDERGHP